MLNLCSQENGSVVSGVEGDPVAFRFVQSCRVRREDGLVNLALGLVQLNTDLRLSGTGT